MGMIRHAVVCTLLASSISATRLAAQQLSAAVALPKPFYGGGDYSATHGDWQAEGTVRYAFAAPIRVGVGVGGGKFDEPYSDPSFSSVWLHLEASFRSLVRPDLQTWVGARYGWTHERVGDRESGLWAWGWLGGAVGGVDYALSERFGVGVQIDVMLLNLRRDESGVPPPGGLDREGWRVSVGPVLRFGGGSWRPEADTASGFAVDDRRPELEAK
jgi:hypothetical protein